MTRTEKDFFLNLAVAAALAAGKDLLDYHDELRGIESTRQRDIKIRADRHSEKMLIEHLQRATHLGILSEEAGLMTAPGRCDASDPVWIVDPLDGTLNYSRDVPFSCVSIALSKAFEPILGVVYDFNHGDLFTGIVGEGAWLNHSAITPSRTQSIEDAVLGTGFPVKRDFSEDSLLPFLRQVQKFRKIRLLGSAALSLCYVACGRLDAYWEENIMFWDVAAGLAIVRAAGGKVELADHYGIEEPVTALASNPFLPLSVKTLKE